MWFQPRSTRWPLSLVCCLARVVRGHGCIFPMAYRNIRCGASLHPLASASRGPVSVFSAALSFMHGRQDAGIDVEGDSDRGVAKTSCPARYAPDGTLRHSLASTSRIGDGFARRRSAVRTRYCPPVTCRALVVSWPSDRLPIPSLAREDRLQSGDDPCGHVGMRLLASSTAVHLIRVVAARRSLRCDAPGRRASASNPGAHQRMAC